MREISNNQNILRTQLIPPGTDEDSEEKAKRIARFSQYVLNEKAWFRTANELVAAMELLEPPIKNYWECLCVGPLGTPMVDRKNSEAQPGHSLIDVHMMLAGLAIENLCKGHLAARLSLKERKDVEAGNFPKFLKNHKILDLVTSTGMTLSDIEKDLVERLGKAIDWRGRYPSPISHEEIVPFARSECDVGRIKAFLQKLRAHVGAKDS